jgi:DNA primase
VIVEGYLDVIALHQAGFMNVVSPMGTALTEEQMFLIKKYTRRIVLALDADAAGEKATLRGLEIARSASDQDTDFIFPVNGYMQQVKRINADIRVATLPPGKDPDEVVEQDIEEWKGLIIKAKPLVIHVMDTLADGKDIKDPRTKGEIAALVSPLIEDVLSPVERDAYRQRLARLLRVDEASISGQTNLTPGIGRRSVKRSTSPGKPVHSQGLAEVKSGTAEYILTLLASDPDLLYKLDRMLQQAGLARIDGDDFVQTPLREVFELIRQAVDQDEIEPVDFVRNNISNLLGSDALKLDNLSNIGTSGRDYLTDLYRQFLRLRESVYKGELQKLRFLLEEESSSEYREADADITGQVVRFNALLNQIFSATSRLSLPKS